MSWVKFSNALAGRVLGRARGLHIEVCMLAISYEVVDCIELVSVFQAR